MKNKVSVLIITIFLAVILFCISTYMQKKLINYEATVSCLILNKDINANEIVSEDYFKKVEMPMSIVAMQRIVTDYNSIAGLYAKDNIKSGQIAIRTQFDTKENLSLYEIENGKEKLSIKIKNSDNAMSYQIKENSYVNIYATLRNEYGALLAPEKERLIIGDEYDGYTVIKLLDNVKVLGTFTSDGIEYTKSNGESMDSILIAVTPEEAKEINLVREIASFNITGVNVTKIEAEKQVEGELLEEKVIISNESGEQ